MLAALCIWGFSNGDGGTTCPDPLAVQGKLCSSELTLEALEAVMDFGPIFFLST